MESRAGARERHEPNVGIMVVSITTLILAACGSGAPDAADVTTTVGIADTAAEAATTTTSPEVASDDDTTTTRDRSDDESSEDAAEAIGRIAWSSDRDGNREIYVMDVASGEITRLTNDPAADLFPAWSPDGSQIAFVSERDGNREIYVMGADGSNVTRLTDNPGEDNRPAWSPDGTQIAFASQRGPANPELWIMNADGSDQRRLAAAAETIDAPVWSPDGTQIAYQLELQFGPFEIHYYDLEDEEGGVLFEGGAEPSWSPDGTTILYTTHPGVGMGVFEIGSQGGSVLIDDPVRAQDPHWSPAGDTFVFWSERDGNPELYLASADGSELTRLTDDPGVDRNPAWAP